MTFKNGAPKCAKPITKTDKLKKYYQKIDWDELTTVYGDSHDNEAIRILNTIKQLMLTFKEHTADYYFAHGAKIHYTEWLETMDLLETPDINFVVDFVINKKEPISSPIRYISTILYDTANQNHFD